MTIRTRLVDYTHGDQPFEGFLAWDDAVGSPRPAVAIAHAWGGRSAFEEGRAIRLAEQGYVGFAIDIYGKGVRGSNPEENAALMAPFLEDRPLLQARINEAVTVLRQQPEVDAGRLAAMGFCFGGLCVLDLARSGSDVLGVASFHGLFAAPGNTAGNRIGAKVLCLHGYDDPMVPPQSVLDLAAELTDAGADWQLHAYGNTLHSFTNPDANDPAMGAVYDAAADRRSWAALLDFLGEIFA
ncbi:MAG: dienelactone hydrolase family protein [Halioglobus sp.]|jgi:dienelactone hydrolase